MTTAPAQPASTTPIFSDPSGRRALFLTWLARGLCAAFVLVAGAVAFTLLTQVPLPGLGGLLPDRADQPAPRTAPAHEVHTPAGGADARTAATSVSARATRAPDRSAGTAAAERVRTHRAATRTPAHTAGRPATTSSQASSQSPGQSSGAGSGSGAAAAPPPAASPGTPAPQANPQSTTRTRNPKAAPKKASPRVVNEPNAHAATGRGAAQQTVDPTSTPPGQSK